MKPIFFSTCVLALLLGGTVVAQDSDITWIGDDGSVWANANGPGARLVVDHAGDDAALWARVTGAGSGLDHTGRGSNQVAASVEGDNSHLFTTVIGDGLAANVAVTGDNVTTRIIITGY